jgi:hypothetical protein
MALGEFFSQFQALLFGSEDVLRNRRHQPRLALDLPVTVEVQGAELPAQVRDFGPNGMRLQMLSRLPRGRKLQVRVLPDSGLEGASSLGVKVAWCKPHDGEFQLGCSYDDKPETLATSWVQMLLAQRHQRSQDRRDRRVEATIPALILEADVTPQSVFVLDLGLGGARVYSAMPWSPQSQPRLSFGIPGQSSSVDFAVELVDGSRVQDGTGWTYRLRFLDSDSKRVALLRKMLLQLLEGVKKAGRTRPADVIPVPVQRPQPAGPGKLAGAVRGPQAPRRSAPRGVSAYLKAPELPPPRPKPLDVSAASQAPPAPAAVLETLPVQRVNASTRMQTGLLPLEARQRRRGWLPASLDGWFPGGEMVSDFLPRPTSAFFRCLSPMLCGAASWAPFAGWSIDTELDRGFNVGPGCLWIDRMALTHWWIHRRALVEWVEGALRTRDRLERRSSNLRQRAFHLLSLLACGGPLAVRQMLVAGQVAVGIARHSGVADPMVLNQLRLSALLKDIGEALLLLGSQSRPVRDRYVLHLNGLEHGEPEMAELTSDWSGFRCPSELHVSRLRVDPLVLEMMPCHPHAGEYLLGRLGFPAEMRTAVRHHHEAWGGLGFPEGLAQEEIPWAARCLAVADGFATALTHLNSADRSYAAVAQLEGSFYDPALVACLQLYLQEMGVLH